MQIGPGPQIVNGVNEERKQYFASLDQSASTAIPELSAESIQADRSELKNSLKNLDFNALPANAYEAISPLFNISISAKPELNRYELNGFYQDLADSFAASAVELVGQSPETSVRTALPEPEATFSATAQYSNAPDYIWIAAAKNALNTTIEGKPDQQVTNRIKQLELNMIFTTEVNTSGPASVNLAREELTEDIRTFSQAA